MSLNRAILAGAGIAAGVTALIVVIGVMGGLQQGYIDSILEISSFHLRVELPEAFDLATLEAFRAIPGVSSAVAFKETHALALGPSGQTTTLNLRAFQKGTERYDPSLVRALGLPENSTMPHAEFLLLGKEAAASLGIDPGLPVELFGMTQSENEGIQPVKGSIILGSTFSSGYYEFDASMGFVQLDKAGSLERIFSSTPLVVGIKLDNRYADYRAAKEIRELLPADVGEIVSWRDYNRSFFGALRTEKSMMMLLVSLIFVVVGINIFHALRRVIASKTSDIALLKACGASDRDIRSLFILEGFAVGTLGALTGTALGLFLSYNINGILDYAASIMRFLHSLTQKSGISPTGDDFRLFSPSYFYIDAIPVSIATTEILFIAATAIVSTSLAAFIAARKVSEAKPSEVFRNE
ncbi:MAG: FtsX-like permease family protein [Rectinemataceae bacterium]